MAPPVAAARQPADALPPLHRRPRHARRTATAARAAPAAAPPASQAAQLLPSLRPPTWGLAAHHRLRARLQPRLVQLSVRSADPAALPAPLPPQSGLHGQQEGPRAQQPQPHDHTASVGRAPQPPQTQPPRQPPPPPSAPSAASRQLLFGRLQRPTGLRADQAAANLLGQINSATSWPLLAQLMERHMPQLTPAALDALMMRVVKLEGAGAASWYRPPELQAPGVARPSGREPAPRAQRAAPTTAQLRQQHKQQVVDQQLQQVLQSPEQQLQQAQQPGQAQAVQPEGSQPLQQQPLTAALQPPPQQQAQQGPLQPEGPQLSLTKYASADLRTFLLQAAQSFSGMAAQATPRQLAHVLWAFAKLGYHPGDAHTGAWVAAFEARMGEADAVSLSQFVWALATAPGRMEPGEQLLLSYEAAALRRLRHFSAQGVSNVLWAFAKLEVGVQRVGGAGGARQGALAVSGLGLLSCRAAPVCANAYLFATTSCSPCSSCSPRSPCAPSCSGSPAVSSWRRCGRAPRPCYPSPFPRRSPTPSGQPPAWGCSRQTPGWPPGSARGWRIWMSGAGRTWPTRCGQWRAWLCPGAWLCVGN